MEGTLFGPGGPGSLLYRPLLWMVVAALAGSGAGPLWNQLWGGRGPVWPLWLVALVFVGMGGLLRRYPWRCRALLFAGLALIFCARCAARVLPPVGDISERVAIDPGHRGPIKTTRLSVEGVVAGFARRSDFASEFPLRLMEPLRGQVWVRAPYDVQVAPGDHLKLPLELRALQIPGNAGERAAYWQAVLNHCWVVGRVKDSATVQVLPGKSFALLRRVALVRDRVSAHYRESFEHSGLTPYGGAMSQVLGAMVFGEGGLSAALPARTREDFRLAGLSHLLVASGAQCALIAAIILAMARGVGARGWLLLAAVGPGVMVYAAIAGDSASIGRAVLAGMGLTCALVLGRDNDGLSLLALAALVLMLVEPIAAWSLSFQLTFAATFGLIVIAPALERWWVGQASRPAWVEMVGLTLAAQMATTPVTLYHFGSASLAGLGANLIAVPISGLLLLTGTASLLWSDINGVNYWLCRFLCFVAGQVGSFPAANWQSYPVSWTLAAMVAILPLLTFSWSSEDGRALRQWAASRVRRRWEGFRGPRPLPVLTAMAGVALLLTWIVWVNKPDERLRVTVMDVGQGDCILVQSGDRAALIDGGAMEGQPRSDIGRSVIVPALQAAGVERLDLLVLTHTDADHCNGLREVVREVPVGEFWDGPRAAGLHRSPGLVDYQGLVAEIQRRQVRRVEPRAGSTFQFGASQLTVLGPVRPPLKGENENSVVLRFDYGKTSVLLAGDIEKGAETALVRQGARLDCTVLKVAHHGSNTSSTPAFLRAAQPRLAIVSCGRYNEYGHPAAATLQRLENAGIRVLRTDVSGAVSVTCDGARCTASSYK